MGVVPPEPGFNQFLAETCAAHGALFVSDEVMTGFRASRAGPVGPRRRRRGLDPRPDDLRQGDGRRLPGGRVRRPGRRDGGCSRRKGRSTRPGTLSGNPIATTAGLATLRLATDDVYAHLTAVGDDDQGRRGRGPDRGRRAAHRAVRRHHVLRLLHRRPGPRLRRRPAPGHRGVRGVLPRDARPRRLPAAVGVRGVVRLRRPRRARRADRARRPAPAAPRARPRPPSRKEPMADTTVVHLLRHGEVHNPEGVLYGRRDGYHLSELGRKMAQRVADTDRRPRHRPPAHLAAGARPGDGRPAGRGPWPRRRSSTRG